MRLEVEEIGNLTLLHRANHLAEAYQFLDRVRPLEAKWTEQLYAERMEAASIAPLIDELQSRLVCALALF
jgi:hypothetical protein